MSHRRSWRTGAAATVAALAAIVSGAVVPPATAKGAAGADRAIDAVARGRQIYQAQCAQCHGVSGRGDGRAACDFDVRPSDLTDPDLADESDTALTRRLLHARKPMPDFENVLTGGERRAVVAYVRTLATRSPALASGGDR